MTLQEFQQQALQLSVEERWQLVNVIMRSLQPPIPLNKAQGVADRLIGIAKTKASAPTDQEVEAMLDERRTQKYLE